MDALMLILLCIVIILCLILGIYSYLYNNIQDYIVKINEVESIIDTNLRNKYDTLNKIISIIKNNEKLSKKINSKIFEELMRLKAQKISNFDLDRKLIATNIEIDSLKQKYKELDDSEEIKNLTKKINEYDEKLEVNRDYYNKNIAEYNKLIKTFPTNIIAKICKYNEKLFFDRKDMSDDDYDDFKL